MIDLGLDIRGWLGGRGRDLDAHWALNERSNTTIRWGHGIHIFAACLFCALIAGPWSYMEVAAATLLSTALCRLVVTWRLYPPLIKQPLTILTGIAIIYFALGILWSPDKARGLEELDVVRWVFIVGAIWPVRHLRPVLILLVSLSFVSAHVCQLVQALAFEFGWESLDFNAFPNRISGWLHHASGASVLVGGLGLHLPAALSRKHPLRWPARGLAILTMLGVLATGSRAAWIAAALTIGVAVLLAIWTSSQRTRLLIGVGVAALGTLLAAWLTIGDEIASRYDEARSEIARAVDKHDYKSSTGARINMFIWAGKAFSAHPIVGVGTGGFQAWSIQTQLAQGLVPDEHPVYADAHSSPMQIAATQGVVGLAIYSVLAVALVAWAWPRKGEERTYQAGLAMAILGLLLCVGFDSIHLKTDTMAALWTFVALAARPSRPY